MFKCNRWSLFISSDFNIGASLKRMSQLLGTGENTMYDPPVVIESFQSLLHGIHDWAGLGWVSTLLVCATSFRIITLPLYVCSSLVSQIGYLG